MCLRERPRPLGPGMVGQKTLLESTSVARYVLDGLPMSLSDWPLA